MCVKVIFSSILVALIWFGAARIACGAANTTPARTYRNPLMPERQLADPQVLKVGETYYLYATTDTRGYQVFTSTNLLDWKLAGRAFEDARGGDWAPEVFHNQRGDGKYYLYYTDSQSGTKIGSGKQIGVAMGDSPLGPFKDVAVLVTNAIDAHPFQDDDGKLYLYYVDLSAGFKIMVVPMSNPTTKQGEAKFLINPTAGWERKTGEVTEGPFIVKHKGVYYLMYSGSGANSPNYGIGYATSKSPLGPFEKYAGNPIVQRGGAVIGPGHHCVVTAPNGKLWLVYHQKWKEETSYHRFLAIDPMWFDDQGVIHATATRDSDQLAP